jgi:radical SAM protein with 4Fe4S-binding SPASM domain
VAVSWYRSPYTLGAIACLLEAGVKTNVHYVLSNATVDEAVGRLEGDDFPAGINAVVFLLHKPVGQGTYEQVIDDSNEAFWRLVSLVDGRDHPFQIGFDSCTVPALVRKARSIDARSLDTCEGARWSAYVTPDLKMLPCSFDNQDLRWAVDLHGSSIAEAWEGPVFEDFRRRLRSACPACPVRDGCMGGCPICPEIVLCHDPARVCSSA